MWWWRMVLYTRKQELFAQWGAACGGIVATAPFMRPFYIGVGAVAGGALGYLYRFVVPAAVGYVAYKQTSLCKVIHI
jgi:hypothetical protein